MRAKEAPIRQTNGFLETLNGLFQAAKRKARGYRRFSTCRTVIFLIAGTRDFSGFDPHSAQPTRNSEEPYLWPWLRIFLVDRFGSVGRDGAIERSKRSEARLELLFAMIV